MNAPDNVSDMQNYILQKLVQKPPVANTKPDRVWEKFTTKIGQQIDTHIKDNLFHEVAFGVEGFEQTHVHEFVGTASETLPVSIFRDLNGMPSGYVKCDASMPDFLSRLYFGADLESSPETKNATLTQAEIGLLNVFAELIARSMTQNNELDSHSIETMVPSGFDLSEIENELLLVCNYRLKIGKYAERVMVAVPKKSVSNVDAEPDIGSMSTNINTKEEIKRSPILASIEMKADPLPLHQIRDWKVGDCLKLTDSEFLKGTFVVGEQEIFSGDVGKAGDHYSFRVSTTEITDDLF